jgi:hypothetical protein
MSDTTYVSENTVTIDRRSGVCRRQAEGDRRQTDIPVSEERRQGQRRKGQRRRQIDPTTCERDYSQDELEFMRALDDYKRKSRRMFPTCSEVLEVIRSLGYVKLAEGEAPRAPEISTPQLQPEGVSADEAE